jgi:hypothetical protein
MYPDGPGSQRPSTSGTTYYYQISSGYERCYLPLASKTYSCFQLMSTSRLGLRRIGFIVSSWVRSSLRGCLAK